MRITYHSDQTQIHWSDLCGIYEIAPLGTRNPDDLETVFSNSMFKCFVFDDRVTVNHQLEKGSYDQCHACRLPITDEDKLSTEYQPGISCPHCFGKRTEEDRARYAERQKQIKLARERGQEHIGPQSELKSG